MHCVVTAGGLPRPDDPLYDYSQGKTKALIDMGGRTMLERVIDALQAAQEVDDIVVVGLGSDLGMSFAQPVDHLPDQGSLIGNVIAGIHYMSNKHPGTEIVALCSSDIPLISGEIVDQFIQSCTPYDHAIYYNMVTKEVMEARFPGSNRTFVRLKGVQIAGGDLLVAHTVLADSHRELWEALTHARKHAWKLARVVGFRFLFKFLFRQVGVEEVETAVYRIIKRPVQVILSPHAELGMDADKPYQVDLLRAEFEKNALSES
jgi:molybdopterin-guanine dinucleotide biosynthesis protein A